MNIHSSRNEPCPCGSGLKFKKCHGATAESVPKEVIAALKRAVAREKQREDQQGLGQPINSVMVGRQRFVVVGSDIFSSDRWKTFPDFLVDYVKHLFGEPWRQQEEAKPEDQQHPFLQLYAHAAADVAQGIKVRGTPTRIRSTGRIAAVLELAYSLYLVAHNARLLALFMKRLKHRDLFWAAAYEAMVTGMLLKAGFNIDFDDETDSTRDHVELTAMYKATGTKFSVEAKRRRPHVTPSKVGSVLHKAFKSSAKHMRLIFIGAELPWRGDDWLDDFREVISGIRSQETRLTIDGEPAPSAYIVFTNTPYEMCPGEEYRLRAAVEGFKIPDLKLGATFSSLDKALDSRERHKEILSLIESIAKHRIPTTFDGEIPSLAFGEHAPRLEIGSSYMVDSGDEKVPAELLQALVMEKNSMAFCIMRLPNGNNALYSIPLTEAELEGYKDHPETFFGTVEAPKREMRDLLDAYDFFFSCYGNAPKENLLQFLLGRHNFEQLKELEQPRLARLYCMHKAECLWAMILRDKAARISASK